MTSHKDEWEEEFDGRFGQFWSKHLGGNVVYGGDITQPPTTWVTVDQEAVKSFITHLLATQKKVLVEKLEIAKEPLPAITMSAKEAVSFNKAIDTAIALIQE